MYTQVSREGQYNSKYLRVLSAGALHLGHFGTPLGTGQARAWLGRPSVVVPRESQRPLSTKTALVNTTARLSSLNGLRPPRRQELARAVKLLVF